MRRTFVIAGGVLVLVAAGVILFAFRDAPAQPWEEGASGGSHAPARPWREVAPGVSHVHVVIPGGAGGEAFRVDLGKADIRVVDARDAGGRLTAAALRSRVPGAVVAVNGGFFDQTGQPMGLVRTGGRETNPLRHADWGVFWVAHDHAGIVHARDWRGAPKSGATEAIQAGPRLVVGHQVMKLKDQLARRTVVCVRSPSEVVLLVTEPVSAPALAQWLATPRARGGLECTDALNLDGGPSTQLSFASEKGHLEIKGGYPVPTGLVVVPRQKR